MPGIDELLRGAGLAGPLLATAHARVFRDAVWLRVAQSYGLTPTERRVGMLLAGGKSAEEIGEILTMTHTSVKRHIGAIRVKLLLSVHPGERQSIHRVTAKLLLTAVGYLDHGLPGEDDA
jgi:DNA-binding NarL/FixJ family response regulator